MEHVEITEVTPALAAEWLSRNTHNRNLRQRIYLAYAADMAAGNWRLNGESIKFAAGGALLDGQHRLQGVIEADVTVRMLVIHDLPGEIQDTIDGGLKRKFSDVLHLRGEANAYLLAAITRRVTLWQAGVRKMGSAPYAPTNAELLSTLEKYPDLRELTTWAHTVAEGCSLPASTIGLCMWLFAGIDAENAAFFFDRLKDGQALVKGDPVYELRKTADNAREVRGARSVTYLSAITIKAWNAYRDGDSIGLLAYRPGGERPERFPEPH